MGRGGLGSGAAVGGGCRALQRGPGVGGRDAPFRRSGLGQRWDEYGGVGWACSRVGLNMGWAFRLFK